jgi:hypothetical protein
MDDTTTFKGNATPSFLEQVLRRAGLIDETIMVRVRPRHIEILGSEQELVPADLPDDERTRRLRIVRRLYGLWSEQDEIAFRKTRTELWSQWQSRGLG